MSHKQKEIDTLLDILDFAGKIESFTADISDADCFFKNELVFDAVLMNLVNIGESIARLSDEFITEHNEVPWQKIKNLRNIIAHDYLGIDAEEIWQIIKNRLPEFKDAVEDVLKALQEGYTE